MPNASAPKAPWVEVCESPQTIVMPGWVSPSCGPTTCTMPCSASPIGYSRTPNSRSSCAASRPGCARPAIARSGRCDVRCVGTLWSSVASVRSGRRTGRPASAGRRTPAGWSPRAPGAGRCRAGRARLSPRAHHVRVPDLLGQCPCRSHRSSRRRAPSVAGHLRMRESSIAAWDSLAASACSTKRSRCFAPPRRAIRAGRAVRAHRAAPGDRAPAGGRPGGARPAAPRHRRPLAPRAPLAVLAAAGADPLVDGRGRGAAAAARPHRRERAGLPPRRAATASASRRPSRPAACATRCRSASRLPMTRRFRRQGAGRLGGAGRQRAVLADATFTERTLPRSAGAAGRSPSPNASPASLASPRRSATAPARSSRRCRCPARSSGSAGVPACAGPATWSRRPTRSARL